MPLNKLYVGKEILMDEEILRLKIENLISANKVLCEEAIKNGSLYDLELIQGKLDETIEQLSFWFEQDNQERFFYELKQHLQWMIKEFPQNP